MTALYDVVVLPTGSGKTPLLSAICSDAVQKWNVRVCVLAHVKELLEQAADKLAKFLPPGNAINPTVGLYSAGLRQKSVRNPVVVAGIQSVYKNALKLCDPRPISLVIIDEAHLVPAHDAGMYRTFIADLLIYAATIRTIPAAFRYLDWLKKVASLVTARPECSPCPECEKDMCKCECNMPSASARRARRLSCRCRTGMSGMEWITLMGFPVLHRKIDRGVMRIDTVVGNHRLQTSFSTEPNRVDRTKMRQGVAANYTHSYDAAMLWDVAGRLADRPLALVHDSFGTLPSRSSRLAKELREAFVRLYSRCRLSQFRDDAVAQLRRNGREDLIDQITPLPEMGQLNIKQALESEYIFS